MPMFYAADAAAGSGSLLLMMVVMLAVMYFLMIRPENKRKKQAEEMRSSLKKGDQITTIDDRVRMELTKWAVSTNNSNPPVDKKGRKARTEEPPQIEEGSGGETK